MIILLRALVRLLAFLMLAGLAIAGLAIAVFCLGTGKTGISLPHLATLVHLPQLRVRTGAFLASLEAGGPVAIVAALAGAGAMLLGLLLLLGVLVRRRERLVSANGSGGERIAARRRPLAQMAVALAEQVDGVTAASARVRPGRRRGGRLTVRAQHTALTEPDEVQKAVAERIEPLSRPFGLRARVRARVAEVGARVQ